MSRTHGGQHYFGREGEAMKKMVSAARPSASFLTEDEHLGGPGAVAAGAPNPWLLDCPMSLTSSSSLPLKALSATPRQPPPSGFCPLHTQALRAGFGLDPSDQLCSSKGLPSSPCVPWGSNQFVTRKWSHIVSSCSWHPEGSTNVLG